MGYQHLEDGTFLTLCVQHISNELLFLFEGEEDLFTGLSLSTDTEMKKLAFQDSQLSELMIGRALIAKISRY